MKTTLYPKTYARLIKVIDKDFSGRLLSWTQQIYIFEVVRKEGDIFVTVDPPVFIEQRYPNRLGHTPNRAERISWVEKIGKKKYTHYGYKMVGEVFKLYQRPQDNGRWTYRWLGQ